MRVLVKTLGGDALEVEVASDVPALTLKEAVCAQRGWQVGTLRLACNGKELADTDPLTPVAEFLASGTGRFVVAVVRANVQLLDTTPTVHNTEPPAPSATPPPPTAPPPTPASDNAITQLVEMGFDRGAAARALIASHGSLARAVDFLTSHPGGGGGGGGGNGHGESSHALPSSSRAGAPGSSASSVADGLRRLGRGARAAAVARELAADDRQMAALRRMPEVQRLLQLPRLAGIEQRPEELQRLLAGILRSPSLQEAMKRGAVTEVMVDEALRDETPEEGATRAERFLAMAQQTAQQRQSQEQVQRQVQPPHSSLEERLTGPEEAAAVSRLVELGFSRARALEAYLVCERNEATAASLLFQQMDG